MNISIDDADDEKIPWLFPRFLEAASKSGHMLVAVRDGLHRIGNGPTITVQPLQFAREVEIEHTTPSFFRTFPLSRSLAEFIQ